MAYDEVASVTLDVFEAGSDFFDGVGDAIFSDAGDALGDEGDVFSGFGRRRLLARETRNGDEEGSLTQPSYQTPSAARS